MAVATRDSLIAAARDLFAARGYADVGTEEIVARAGLTRGALYHHFADKKDLFRAVHEGLEQELLAWVVERMAGVEDAWDALVAGTRAFLDACLEPAVIRIALLDAPAVLGWAEFREIDARYGLGLVSAGLEAGMEQGLLRRQEVQPLAHLVVGAMGEAAMLIANAEDARAARREMEPALLGLLEGLKA